MHRFWKGIVVVAALLVLAAPPALAVDLSMTAWDVDGRSRVWARSVGREFGPMSGQLLFHGDGTFELTGSGITGTWQDEGGRRFSGELDDAALEQALRDFINGMTGAVDATILSVRVDRVWGHVNRNGDVIKMKLRFKVWFSADSVGIAQRGAWIKINLRGTLSAGQPG